MWSMSGIGSRNWCPYIWEQANWCGHWSTDDALKMFGVRRSFSSDGR